jgi:serine/threonine protein kinase
MDGSSPRIARLTYTKHVAQSPGVGGFTGTPLFMSGSREFPSSENEFGGVPADSISALMPPSLDIFTLMLSMSSHRSTDSGVIAAWMSGHDLRTIPSRLRLVTVLQYVLNEVSPVSSASAHTRLTWRDIQYLEKSRTDLLEVGADGSNLVYLVSIVLEIESGRDLSLKFRKFNMLDFSDQITARGWMDGGKDSDGILSEELRVWFKQKVGGGVIPIPESCVSTQRHPRISSPRITSRSQGSTPPGSQRNDSFSALSVDRVFGGSSTGTLARASSAPSLAATPRNSRSRAITPSDEEGREIVVVDIQTDHALRRHINKAVELRRDSVNDQTFVRDLRKYILRRVHFETPDTAGTVLEMAKANAGFVHIGDVRSGAQSRHFAILFKTLCDASGVYCRLVRDSSDAYYNVVMVSDIATGGTAASADDSAGESDEVESETPEELIHVFWEPSQNTRVKRVFSHPLDKLMQQCNSSSDSVDLDDFFIFDTLLGKGSFGEVWKVDIKAAAGKAKKSPSDMESIFVPGLVGFGPFALKLIPPEEADKEEASFMRIYGHSQVVKVLAVFRGYQVLENRKREMEEKPAMCILMQLAEKCLETVLTGSSSEQENGSRRASVTQEPMDLKFAFKVLLDSARAMSYLHAPSGQRPHLVHRDLKPGNILITHDSRAIITDFGVARVNPSLETNLTVGAGTEGYMAPEQKTLLYDRPADVYSFGIIIARILGIQNWKETMKLTAEDFRQAGADPFLAELCMKCAQESPLHRPSFDQIHQVLLCEFIRREFSCMVISALEVSRRPVRHGLRLRNVSTPSTPSNANKPIKLSRRNSRKL